MAGAHLAHLVLRENPRPTTDFRSVYASVAANDLGDRPVPIVGGSFPPIPFV